jgi:hypothetical protein
MSGGTYQPRWLLLPVYLIIVLLICLVGLIQTANAASTKPQGEWSQIYTWPDVAIHLSLLPDGKVVSFSDDDHGEYHTKGTRAADFSKGFVIDIPINGEPLTGDAAYIPNRSTNLFCSGHSLLPDGRLFISGGHEGKDHLGSQDITILNKSNGQYVWGTQSAKMAYGRWYPTVLTLANGEMLMLAGSRTTSTDENPLPEVWKVGGGIRALTAAVRDNIPYFPNLHVAPNGKTFMAGPSQATSYLTTSGTGSWSAGPARKVANRRYGPSVMYAPGKILMAGGGDPATKTAEIINLGATNPSWTYTNSMAYARRHHNATILPDGKVLVTGGTAASNDETKAVFAAEVWDPAIGGWITMASMKVPRLYHSSALLLPDGRVLSSGGGRGSGGKDYKNAEIFSPPYLFDGSRPTIESSPASANYGQTFFVGTPNVSAITKVSLIKLGSTTHTNNMNQLINFPSFTKATNGLNVALATNRNAFTPGHYLLFILNSNGVPSIAKVIHIS